MIRFHLDQHAPNAVAHGLRLRGIDVTTTAEAHLQDATDGEHLVYALQTGRVVFTHDDDFLRHHHDGIEHAGIVYSTFIRHCTRNREARDYLALPGRKRRRMPLAS